MSWTKGEQTRRETALRNNMEMMKIEGFLEEKEAKIALYEFLRNNITFTNNKFNFWLY